MQYELPGYNCNANASHQNHNTNICRNFEQRCHYNHRSNCPAKNCNNCGILNHFAIMYRKPKRTQTQTLSPQHTSNNQIQITPEKDDEEELVNYISSYGEVDNQLYGSIYDGDSDDNYIAAPSSETVSKLEPLNAMIEIRNIYVISITNSGTLWSMLARTFANNIVINNSTAQWIDTTDEKDIKVFSMKPSNYRKTSKRCHIQRMDMRWCTLNSSRGWPKGHRNDGSFSTFSDMQCCSYRQQRVNHIMTYITFLAKFKQAIASQFPELVSRFGLSKTHIGILTFGLKLYSKAPKRSMMSN